MWRQIVCCLRVFRHFPWGGYGAFFCYSVAIRILVLASIAFGLSAEDAAGQVVVEGRRAPRLGKSRPVLAPYVDNLNVVLYDREDYVRFRDALRSVLTLFRLAFRFECEGRTS